MNTGENSPSLFTSAQSIIFLISGQLVMCYRLQNTLLSAVNYSGLVLSWRQDWYDTSVWEQSEAVLALHTEVFRFLQLHLLLWFRPLCNITTNPAPISHQRPHTLGIQCLSGRLSIAIIKWNYQSSILSVESECIKKRGTHDWHSLRWWWIKTWTGKINKYEEWMSGWMGGSLVVSAN